MMATTVPSRRFSAPRERVRDLGTRSSMCAVDRGVLRSPRTPLHLDEMAIDAGSPTPLLAALPTSSTAAARVAGAAS